MASFLQSRLFGKFEPQDKLRRTLSVPKLCFFADAVFPVGDDEPEESDDENKFDCEVEAVEDLFEAWVGVPGCA